MPRRTLASTRRRVKCVGFTGAAPSHVQVYLPIAEMSVDALLLAGIGFGVGWLSGLFGVGGGFLLTPVLLLIGIPAQVAVASGANQTLGASVSGLMAQAACWWPVACSVPWWACSFSRCCGAWARWMRRWRCSTWWCWAWSAA
jgi:hypothetical protein